jgi:threonine/homoserine/homoserine lactone efflux protein
VETLWLFMKGFTLGFSVAVPVGPIGVMCVQRALRYGRNAGFATGMGAAAADGMYGLVAGLGLASVTSFFETSQGWIQLVGGGVLMLVGGRMVNTHIQLPRDPGTVAAPVAKTKRRLFAESFVLTLTNPLTLLGFLAVFAGIGLPSDSTPWEVGLIVLGVIAGSAAWWLFLSATAAHYRERLPPQLLDRFNRGAGYMIVIFGIAAVYQGLSTILQWKPLLPP